MPKVAPPRSTRSNFNAGDATTIARWDKLAVDPLGRYMCGPCLWAPAPVPRLPCACLLCSQLPTPLGQGAAPACCADELYGFASCAQLHLWGCDCDLCCKVLAPPRPPPADHTN